ncbi:phosphotransferase family protein [Nocardia pseudovaccinii]|uniref:phosphotransferase family protein n=1 Tax=Nocardia pseudovaccinii TaxID=189540 RepID=UPI0007A550C9|nr:phosphotransferase [Nocardia pseudovaccinii]
MPYQLTLPHSPADITASWLSDILGTGVQHIVVDPIGTGQTGATYRVRLTYTDAVDLPSTLVVKLPAQDDTVRDRVALGYRAEHAFYRDAARTVAVPLPAVYHCAIDRGGADFVLVMADMAPAVQGDQIAGCDPAQARLAVEALAGLHGPRWCDPTWLDFSGATMPKADSDFARGLGELTRLATDTTVQRLGERITGHDRATLLEAADLVEAWLMLQPDRFSLLHGDYRLDNMLFDPAGSTVTVVDWQTISVGLPARDLAYFLGTSLQPDHRNEHEGLLVAHYYMALQAHGVCDYSETECWRDYRLGMLQVPLLTTLGFAFSAATARGDDMALTMLGRGCRAIRELDTLALIRDLARS